METKFGYLGTEEALKFNIAWSSLTPGLKFQN